MKNKKIKYFLVTTLFLILTFIIYLTTKSDSIKFDSTRWTNEFESREKMIDDLIDFHLKTGTSYNQIINRLGYPDSDSFVEGKDEMYYLIKSETSGWSGLIFVPQETYLVIRVTNEENSYDRTLIDCYVDEPE